MNHPKYTPNQRKAQSNLRKHISKCRVQLEELGAENMFGNWHLPTKSIEANALHMEIATAHLALAKFDQTPDGQSWIERCEARANRAFRAYQKEVRWVTLELMLTVIRHQFGLYGKYRLKADVYYGVFPK